MGTGVWSPFPADLRGGGEGLLQACALHLDTLRGRREEYDGVLRHPVGWNEVEDSPIEGGEAASVPHCDGEEMRIRNLPVADDTLPRDEV